MSKSSEVNKASLQCKSSENWKLITKSFVQGECVFKTREQIKIDLTCVQSSDNECKFYIIFEVEFYWRCETSEIHSQSRSVSKIEETDLKIIEIKTNLESDFIFWMTISAWNQYEISNDLLQETLKLRLRKTSTDRDKIAALLRRAEPSEALRADLECKTKVLDKLIYSPTPDNPTFTSHEDLECKVSCTPGRKMSLLNI